MRCTIGNFREYWWGEDFNVISDCSGLQKFSEREANVPHMIHMWQYELLQCQLVISHRPEIIMWECGII